MIRGLEKKNISPEEVPQEVLDEISLNNMSFIAYTKSDMSQDYDQLCKQHKKEVRDAYDKTDKLLSFVEFLERYNE